MPTKRSHACFCRNLLPPSFFLWMIINVWDSGIAEPSNLAPWPEYFSTSRDILPVWARTLRRTASVDQITSFLHEAHVILTIGSAVCEGLGSGRDQEFVDAHIARMESDLGVSYRSCISAQAVLGIHAQTNGHQIYWHIGNEINSEHYSETMGTTGRAHDLTMIPDFVEYFVAPTVQALDEASAQTGFDAPAVLGSIVSGHNPDSRAWLDTILEYAIKGDYAPALTGKRVYEVVDYLSFHYTMAAENWEESLDDMAKWIGQGKIKGIMDTEELGAQAMSRGAAQFQALKGFANLMYWVNKHGYSPREIRLNFWAQGDDTPDEAMTMVHDFFGDDSLHNVAAPMLGQAAGSYTHFALANSAGNKRLIAVFTGADNTASWTNLTFAAEGWSGDVTGFMHIFKTTTGNDRYSTTPVTAVPTGDAYAISTGGSLLAEGTALFLLSAKSPVKVFSSPEMPGDASAQRMQWDGMTMHYVVSEPSTLRFSIYSSGGRIVRNMSTPTGETGGRSMTWNGRDGQGRPVQPGLYLWRVEIGKTIYTGKLVKMTGSGSLQ